MDMSNVSTIILPPPPSGTAQASAEWGRQKSDVMRGAGAAMAKIRDAAGSRGFLSVPGVFIEGMLDAETDLKLKLAEANLSLTKAELQRQLRWNESAVKDTVAQQRRLWDVERARVLNEFQAWASEVKRAYTMDSETVAQESITIDANRLILLNLKTGIEMERETLRQQVVAAGGDTFALERQLQDARLVTMDKRLELIPVIYEIIGVEQTILAERSGSLLSLERQKAAALGALLQRKTDELVPLRRQMAEMETRYANAVRDASGTELEMIGEGLKQAQARLAAAIWERAFTAKTLELANLKLEIQRVEDAARRQGITNELDLSNYQDLAQVNATREGIRLEVGNVAEIGGAQDVATFAAGAPPTIQDLRRRVALAEADWNNSVRISAKQNMISMREWEILCGEKEGASGTLNVRTETVGGATATWSGKGIKNIRTAIDGALSNIQGTLANRAKLWESAYTLLAQDDI